MLKNYSTVLQEERKNLLKIPMQISLKNLFNLLNISAPAN